MVRTRGDRYERSGRVGGGSAAFRPQTPSSSRTIGMHRASNNQGASSHAPRDSSIPRAWWALALSASLVLFLLYNDPVDFVDRILMAAAPLALFAGFVVVPKIPRAGPFASPGQEAGAALLGPRRIVLSVAFGIVALAWWSQENPGTDYGPGSQALVSIVLGMSAIYVALPESRSFRRTPLGVVLGAAPSLSGQAQWIVRLVVVGIALLCCWAGGLFGSAVAGEGFANRLVLMPGLLVLGAPLRARHGDH